MNKNILFVALVATMALISCSKQEQYPGQAQGAGDGKTFTAVIEQQQTKTVLTTANKVEWEVGDKININGAEYSAVPKNPASCAVFIHMNGNAPQTAPYSAIFPVNFYNATSKGLELPSTITYKAGKLNTPMYAESSTEELSFKNICGVLRLSLTGTEKVKSIAITANETICGPFTTDIAQDGTFSMNLTGEGDACKTVTLDCGEQGVQLSDVAKDFFIPLPPREYTAGLTITITGFDEDNLPFEKTTSEGITIARNTLYPLTWEVTFPNQFLLSGEFSVGANKKVRFAKGNLYWDGNTSPATYKFEANQCDFRHYCGKTGDKAIIGGQSTTTPENTVGCFWWVKNTETAFNPYDGTYGTPSPANSSSDILFANATSETPNPTFSVCGKQNVFRTLSKNEWAYLLNLDNTTNGSARIQANRFARAKVKGINGLLVFPDNYVMPDGYDQTGMAGLNIINAIAYPTFSIPESTWTAMESDGVLFLPATGYRENDKIQYNDGKYAPYCASDAKDDAAKGWILSFDAGAIYTNNAVRNLSSSIRLVADINP